MTGFAPVTYLWFIGSAIFPQLLGHTLINSSLRDLSAGFVSISLLGGPVGSTLLVFIILGEKPVLLEILSGAVILAGIYLATRSEAKRDR